MVHHAFSSIPIVFQNNSNNNNNSDNNNNNNNNNNSDGLTCPGSLLKGDIYTHMYHSLVVENGKVHPEYITARERGVVFDLGHGAGSFDWTIAEVCAAQGFWPDTISTDLHTSCESGPAYDLPSVMSKLLHLGMPLYDVIGAATSGPARVMDLTNDPIGSLSEGGVADVVVMRLVEDEAFLLEDCHGKTRCLDKHLRVEKVWKDGVRVR